MFCRNTIRWLLFVATCCYWIPAGCSSAEIWRSGGMARSACEQWEEFNKTGVIPKPIKDVGSTELCGWFSKGMEGDACADIRHFWLGCQIPNATSRIIGGAPSRLLAFPSALYLPPAGCGASIINEEWGLTAAHCVPPKEIPYYLFPGIISYYDNSSMEKIQLISTKIVIHPQYDASVVLNDIALVKFKPKLNWTDAIQPTRLPKENYIHTKGLIGISIGWGIGSNETLHQLDLPIITTERCREIFDGLEEKEDNVTITDDYVCAQYPSGPVRNVCYGDSGSPFYVCEDNKLVQIGVTDFTGGCYSNYPVGYMRVSKYISWIKETVAKN